MVMDFPLEKGYQCDLMGTRYDLWAMAIVSVTTVDIDMTLATRYDILPTMVYCADSCYGVKSHRGDMISVSST